MQTIRAVKTAQATETGKIKMKTRLLTQEINVYRTGMRILDLIPDMSMFMTAQKIKSV